MNNSRPDSLEPALLTIEGEAKKILERPWEAKQKEYGAPFLSTILDMSLVDISRFALNDLHKYCQSYRNFTRETAVSEDVTEVAGVEFMMMTYYHLDKIYQQLARESLSVLVDRVEALNKAGATYAELYNGQPDVQKALRAYKHQMVQSGLEIYATLIQELQKIPQPEIGRTHLDHVFKDLNDANSLAQRVRLATQQMLRDFGRRSTSIVNVGELKSSVQALLLLDQRIHSQLNEYFDWFVSRGKDGKLGDAFVQALITMEKKILLPSAANLERIAKSQNLRSLNEQFVRRKDLDEISRKIGACIFQPYGEQK
jgi:hypothetical protein